MSDCRTLTDIVGPWQETDFDSGLIARCREAWKKPIGSLSRAELATLLRQKIAVRQLVPIAKQKLQSSDDDSEIYGGELAAAIAHAEAT